MVRSTVLVIEADTGEIPGISVAVEESLRSCAFSDDAILDLQLAVEEAVVNTIVHGYRGAAGTLTIAIHVTDSAAEIRIEDRAPAFDPLSLPEPDRGDDLARRRIGGLGVYLLRQMVDDVSYAYADGKNILTLVKKKSA